MITTLLRRLGSRRLPASAEAWAVRMQDGSLNRQEQLAFDAWLKASPANAEDYARCNKLGHLASRLQAHPDLVRSMPAYRALDRQQPGRRRPLMLTVLGAAACAALVIVALPLLPAFHGEDFIVTAHGEQRQIPLQDGSRLHINTDSKLRVAFSDHERRVLLEKGEAFFEVTRDTRRPFVITVGGSEVRVVGTKFSVHRAHQRIDVVVTEGQVKVRPDAHGKGWQPDMSLLPGQKLRLDEAEHRVTLSVVDAERLTAWHSGMIRFDATPLEEVIADINRYTPREFVIDDPKLRAIRLSGNFRIGDMESVRFALRDGFAIEAKERDGRIFLRAGKASPQG